MGAIAVGLSCNVVLESRVDAAGLSKIYFRMIEGRKKRDFTTGVRWPRKYFDKSSQQLFPRYPGDPDVIPYNKKLNDLKAKAHKLLYHEWAQNNDIGLEDLAKLFTDRSNTEDFFKLMELKAGRLYNDDIIGYGTWNRHKSSLHTLKTYYRGDTLSVGKIDLAFIERFDAWCRKKHKRAHNTICGYHKDIKKYLSIAVKMGFIADNPYDNFSFSYVDGDRQALNQDELNRLIAVFKKQDLNENHREVCRQFLFSCFTGLRISDAGRLTSNMIADGILTFVPYKTRGTGKRLILPLQQIAQQLISGRDGKLFVQFSHQYINETLKILAAWANISKRLTYHCARDTFGTQAVEMGIHLKTLCEMMGHHSIKTTTIYTKISEAEKKKAMANFDDRFKL